MASSTGELNGHSVHFLKAHSKGVAYFVALVIFVALLVSYKLYAQQNTLNNSSSNAAVTLQDSTIGAEMNKGSGKTEPLLSNKHNLDQTDVTQTVNSSETNLKVNNQDIPVPPSGIVHKDISGSDGNTSVDLNIQNSNTGNTKSSRSSSYVRIDTDSRTNIRSSITNEISNQIKGATQ
jgi:hypothetical protein